MNFGMVAALALSSVGLTGCSDEQIALGAGVIIGAVIADDSSHHHYPPPRPHRPYRPRRHGHRWAGELQLAVPVLTAEATSDVEKAAAHFAIPEAAAEKVMAALRSAKDQDFTELNKLGFSRDDLMAMAKGENPRASALRVSAEQLGIELEEAHVVIQTMKEDLAQGL